MPEYIERSEAVKFVKQNTPHIDGETTMQCVERSLMNVPAADVVEVVRCKNCKHFDIEEDDALGTCMGKFICISSGGEIYPEPNHFCSYGERRKPE